MQTSLPSGASHPSIRTRNEWTRDCDSVHTGSLPGHRAGQAEEEKDEREPQKEPSTWAERGWLRFANSCRLIDLLKSLHFTAKALPGSWWYSQSHIDSVKQTTEHTYRPRMYLGWDGVGAGLNSTVCLLFPQFPLWRSRACIMDGIKKGNFGDHMFPSYLFLSSK